AVARHLPRRSLLLPYPALFRPLPESAPSSTDQRMWLNGFLAGLSNFSPGAASRLSAPSDPGAQTALSPPPVPVLVLYGSQSGTADRKSTRLNASHVKTSYAVFR